MDGFAALALERGAPGSAAQLAGAAEHLRESLGFETEPAERRFRDTYLAKLKSVLAKEKFADFYEQGRALPLNKAVALASNEQNAETTGKPITSFSTASEKPDAAKSIAVLPFLTLGFAEDEEYLGLGLADALITRLSQTRQLAVRPTSAVRGFVNSNLNSTSIGRELNVGSILEGSLQRAGERMRVTVQLVDVQSESSLWAEKFLFNFTDIFEVQDEIASQVSKALLKTFDSEEHQKLTVRGTENIEAYQAYLKARFYMYKVTPEGAQKAVSYFEQALALAPDYAEAHAGLAETYISGSYIFFSPQEVLPKARQAATKAIELNPQSAEAHVSLGVVKQLYEWDWQGAESELNPNLADAHSGYSNFLSIFERRDEARKYLEEIKAEGDYSPAELAIGYVALGDKEEVFRLLERAFQEHDLQLQYLRVEPGYDEIRSDPRFQDLMRRVGLK